MAASHTSHGGSTGPSSGSQDWRRNSVGSAEAHAQDDVQGWPCEFPDCNKVFVRKDHRSRHALNHVADSLFCKWCGKGFKREDLLERHESRKVCGPDAKPNVRLDRRRTERTFEDPYPLPLSSASSSFDRSNIYPGSSSMMQRPNGSDPIQLTTPIGLPPGRSSVLLQSEVAPRSSTTIVAELEVLPSGWNLLSSQFQPEPWDNFLQEDLAGPYNEAAIVPAVNWDIPTQVRMQESSERGQESLASAAILANIKLVLEDVVDWTLPFLSASIAGYWSSVAPTYPFIHRGTFDLNTTPAYLIAMMAIVGSKHQIMEPSRDFRKLVQKVRGILVQECGLEMPLSTLQAFCLCHVYDTWYGSDESMFVAQCTWPIMVAHSRKKGIGVAGRPETEIQEEEAWTVWAKDEERRRAAFCVLLIDTQLSAFWNQHPSRQLSIFAHNIALPCPGNEWDALNPVDWLRVRQPTQHLTKKPPSSYLPGLHPDFKVNVVTEGYSSNIFTALCAVPNFDFAVNIESALGVQMILMGMMAVAWDCRTRGGMGVKFRDGTQHWRSIVLNAVINLRAAWENAVARIPPSIQTRDMRDTFAISIISVLGDIPMLQVAAGARLICGAAIGPRQYRDAQRRLRMWGKTEDAWTCLWQSARYLRQALATDWGIYTGWATYLTTLIHWGYAWTLSAGEDRVELPPSDEPEGGRNRFLDKILSLPSRPEQLDGNGLADLIFCVAGRLAHSENDCEYGKLLSRLIGSHRRDHVH